MTPDDIARFWPKVRRGEDGDCWIWTAFRDRYGQGRFNVSRKCYSAQRASWEIAYGSVPAGLDVRQRCRNPACVNPAHLLLGRRGERIGEKRCSVCGGAGPFGKGGGKDGLRSQCKVCHVAAVREYTSKHADRVKAANKERRERDPDALRERKRASYYRNLPKNKERLLAKARRLYREDPKRYANRAAYRAANAARHSAYVREWQRANMHRVVAAVKRRRAVKMGVDAKFTHDDWREMLEVFGHRCAYCLRQMTRPEQDHIVALINGGGHIVENIVPACRNCNAKKNARGILSMVNTPTRFA